MKTVFTFFTVRVLTDFAVHIISKTGILNSVECTRKAMYAYACLVSFKL